jgi:hypothetical protein
MEDNPKLKYFVTDYKLTSAKEGSKIAIPVSKGSIGEEGIAKAIVKMGSTVGEIDVLAVMRGLNKAVTSLSEMGFTINLPLFRTSFSMTETYNADGTPAQGGKNKVKINLHKGSKLSEAESNLRTERTNPPADALTVYMVRDNESDTADDKLTPGGSFEVYGNGLKIDGDDPACGLYFVDADGKEYKAGKFTAKGNIPKMLSAMIPQLEPGQYQIKVVTQYAGSKPRKDPKTVVYNTKLTVE